MDTFNLRDLPLVVRRHVLRKTEIIDLYNFSLISKETYAMVKKAFVPTMIRLEFCKTFIVVYFWAPENRKGLNWMFASPAVYPFYESMGYQFLDNSVFLQGMEFKYQYILDNDKPSRTFFMPLLDAPTKLNTLFSYFSDLFNCTQYDHVLFDIKFTQCYRTFLTALEIRKVEFLEFSKSPITGNDLVSVLDCLDGTEELAIDVPFTGYLDCNKINALNFIQCKQIDVKAAAFLKLNIPNIYLKGVRLSEKVLFRFVSKWLKSTDTQLVSVILKIQEPRTWSFAEQFYLKLGALRWDYRRRAKVYKCNKRYLFFDAATCSTVKEWDCSEARDIVRSDGVLASIRLTETSFEMFVWHKRFNDY